jgi:AcrR family transcriptional regulator
VQGAQTREAILDGALQVLSTLGLAGFSIPQVASAVGIAPGNLTYYFPTREDLIRAMSERLLDRYSRKFEDMCAELSKGGDGGLNELVDRMLDDAVSFSTVNMFPELWAMANQHPFVAQSLDRIYDGAVVALLRALGADPGDAAASDLKASAYLLSCLAEGGTALFGRSGARDPRFLAMKKQAKRVMVAALREALRKTELAAAR